MKITERNNSTINRPARVGFDRFGPLFALSLSLSLSLSLLNSTYLLLRKQPWQPSAGAAFCLFLGMAADRFYSSEGVMFCEPILNDYKITH